MQREHLASFDGQLPDLQSYVLALSVHEMFCYPSVPRGVQGMRFCGHEKGASWKESWHEMYAGKHIQKHSEDDKGVVFLSCHTRVLEWIYNL